MSIPLKKLRGRPRRKTPIARLSIKLEPEDLERFKTICAENQTTQPGQILKWMHAENSRDNWESVADWNRPNVDIAADLGTSPKKVHRYRVRHGIPNPNCPKKSYFRWDKVDWSKPNYWIAADMGCTTQAVGYRRKQLAPGSNSKGSK